MKFQIVIAISPIFLFIYLGFVNGEDNELTVEPPDITKDKEVICSAIAVGDPDIKVNIEGMMDYDDLIRLTVWNHKYSLRYGNKVFEYGPDVTWKERLVLLRMMYIFKTACPMQFVNPEFLNVAMKLFMVYQHAINSSAASIKNWNPIGQVLDVCSSQAVRALEMTSLGMDLTGIKLQVGNTKEEVAIFPPDELADASQDIDIIIDTMWWIFSFSVGTCYWSAPNPSFWAARYKRLFYAEFLHPLRSRWLHAGPNTDFGVIFGDFNIERTMKNIRVCVTAAYTKNGLADRQLVRSLTLAAGSLGIEAGLNKKVGTKVG